MYNRYIVSILLLMHWGVLMWAADEDETPTRRVSFEGPTNPISIAGTPTHFGTPGHSATPPVAIPSPKHYDPGFGMQSRIVNPEQKKIKKRSTAVLGTLIPESLLPQVAASVQVFNFDEQLPAAEQPSVPAAEQPSVPAAEPSSGQLPVLPGTWRDWLYRSSGSDDSSCSSSFSDDGEAAELVLTDIDGQSEEDL